MSFYCFDYQALCENFVIGEGLLILSDDSLKIPYNHEKFPASTMLPFLISAWSGVGGLATPTVSVCYYLIIIYWKILMRI